MKYKREFLRAINKLIKHYKSFDGEAVIQLSACPLCRVPSNCDNCPWVLFENGLCGRRDSKTECLERLERWKKLMKEGK